MICITQMGHRELQQRRQSFIIAPNFVAFLGMPKGAEVDALTAL